MVVVKNSYAKHPIKIMPPAKGSQRYQYDEDECSLETTFARIQPHHLPRSFSTCLVVSAYLPEWSAAGHRSATSKLMQDIDEVTTSLKIYSKPLVIIAGDLNGAPTTNLCSALDCHLVKSKATRASNMLDVIITNSPKCYNIQTIGPLGNSDHDMQLARAELTAYSAL